MGLAAVMWGSFFDKVHNPYFTIKLHPLRTYSKCNMALPCEEPAHCSAFISAAMDWCRSCGEPVGCNGVCGDPVGCNGVCGLKNELPIVQTAQLKARLSMKKHNS